LRYYIGIDGGATKTAICAANLDNLPLRYAKTTGSSWRESSAGNVAQNLKVTVTGLIGEGFGEIAGIAMGLPCYGESDAGDHSLEEAINEAFAGIPHYITNDVEVGWAGSLALAPGVNVVAGTGTIAFGKDYNGKSSRSGGYSEFFSDEGSCYWIGRKVLEFFFKQADGRMPKDELYEVVCREFNLRDEMSLIDIIHVEYAGYRDRMASLQLLAEKAALAGSSSAQSIYDDAVRELCLLATAIRNQLDFIGKPWTVSYSGGLFKAGDLILPQFSKGIEKENGILAAPLLAPVDGAVLLAFQHFNPAGLLKIKSMFSL